MPSPPTFNQFSRDNLWSIFSFFDSKSDGYLDRCQTTAALVQFFPLISPRSIAKHVAAANANKFGQLDFDEFCAIAELSYNSEDYEKTYREVPIEEVSASAAAGLDKIEDDDLI